MNKNFKKMKIEEIVKNQMREMKNVENLETDWMKRTIKSEI